MKFAILGYGRMGHQIESIATSLGHNISAVFDIDKPFIAESDVNGADAIIDFTLADSVMENLKAAAALGVPIVEATTGWFDQYDEAVKIPGLTMIASPNFSIGVYQFKCIVELAAKLMGNLSAYDTYLHEWHHTGKADSPSGTAKMLAELLLTHLQNKDTALYETSHGQIGPEQLHVTSSRVGRIPGTHEIGFDSAYDTITLRHQAHSREGFAYGAVKAAEWIAGKSGIFTMDDFMNSMNPS